VSAKAGIRGMGTHLARLEQARGLTEERTAEARQQRERPLTLADRLVLSLVTPVARGRVCVQRGAAMDVVA
jgi:hypothetical protein